MRRSACLLALLGFSVQSVSANDPFSTNTAAPKPAAGAMQFFSARPDLPPETSPQRFTRSAGGSVEESDLQAYYNELFGQQPAAGTPSFTPSPSASPVAAPTPSANRLKPLAPTPPADATAVIHAEYEMDPTAPNETIQTVRAERFSARPFPGGAPGEPTPAADPAQKNLLTEPIPVGESPALAPRGNLNFSRAPEAPAAKAPVPAAETQPGRTAAAPAPVSAAAAAAASTEPAVSSTPTLSLTWKKQTDINVGQECRCELVVKNTSKVPARNVEVAAWLPTSVRPVRAEPAPRHSQEFLGWEIEELKGGEERTFEITLIPLQRGEISTRADVRFSSSASGAFAVAEPMLDVRVEGPTQVMIGEPASHTVIVANPGTGIASQVEIEALLPDGLEHSRGQRLAMNLGALNPGESRSVRLALAATKGGKHVVQVQARSETGLTRTASAEVNVVAPRLATRIQGPGLRYLGRQGTYTLTVVNEGAAATDNVRVMHKIPDGFTYVSSDRGAQFDTASGIVNWFVGRLERGAEAEIKVTLTASKLGEQTHLVRATSEHGVVSDAQFTTQVEGTSSLAIEVRDLEDPVEVGSETVYEVKVKNEGSAAATNVGLACELPAGMTLLHAEGPSQHVSERGHVIFRALPELAAGQTVSFKLKVTAASPGSLRFRAHLSSESIAEPLTAEELTKFYGE